MVSRIYVPDDSLGKDEVSPLEVPSMLNTKNVFSLILNRMSILFYDNFLLGWKKTFLKIENGSLFVSAVSAFHS